MKNNVLKIISDAFFPEKIKCICCNKDLNEDKTYYICEDCIKEIEFNKGTKCVLCGVKIKDGARFCPTCLEFERKFDKAFSPLIYNKNVKKLITNLKFHSKKYLAKYLSKFVIESIKENCDIGIDLVVPVPITAQKEKKRGFNQSYEIAKYLKEEGFVVDKNCLIKAKETKSQVDCDSKERMSNLNNSIEIADKTLVKNKNILIIDDIFTTGSTVNECAKVLKKSKANKVYVCTIATHSFVNNEENE